MSRELQPIDPAEISVVIQGPLYRRLGPHRGIDTCIASVRKQLPGAEIIVSTWEHERVADIPADRIIVSIDPGAMLDCSGNAINTNRMIRSTVAGIRAATRPCVMKFRSDLNLAGTAMARIGVAMEEMPVGPRLFRRPITITTLFTRNPVRAPMLFHVSDIVQFGTREDMLALWDLPLFRREDLFRSRPSCNPFGNYVGYTALRKLPEQSLMIGAMHKHGLMVDLEHPNQLRLRNLVLWESILQQNFSLLDWQAAEVDFPKRLMSAGYALKTVYRTGEFDRQSSRGPVRQRLRMGRALMNQYVFSCFRRAWWVAFFSIVLFSVSPSLARRVRTLWRRRRGFVHPDSGRI